MLLFIKVANSQFYYRGEVVDDKNKLIPGGTIFIHSSKLLFDLGSSGSFGLMSTKPKTDTFTFKADGYEVATIAVSSEKYNIIKLTLLETVANLQKNRLVSKTKDFNPIQKTTIFSGNETYTDLVENDFVNAAKFPVTGFAVNTDKASYSNVRRFINMNSFVPTNAVRIDEMVNYFNFPSQQPLGEKTFYVSAKFSQCPWSTKNLLCFINIAARKLHLENIPPSNLVFLIDNSGSMDLQNKMPLLKSAFKLLVNNLRPIDKISIVTYGGNVQIALQPTSGLYKDSINKVIEEMEASGDTPGESAIKIAYSIAKQNFVKDGNNRVILATDGDFNVGIANEEELDKLISFQSQTGIYLTCLGVGMGNYKDSKLAVLAKKGNGNFAYIDSEFEAEKILVTEFTQTLFSVADKTFINVKFNNDLISQYRLIGFDNKKNALIDNNSFIDGGQIGSGYSTMVLFEIEPTGIINFDDLSHVLGENIANINIKYENPSTKNQETCDYFCDFNYSPILVLPKHYGFATAVAMFGAYIRQSKFINDTKIDEIIILAKQSVDVNNALQKEFIKLLEKAKDIYEPSKKRRKNKT
jgi:Ca-activated chloride channel family protein